MRRAAHALVGRRDFRSFTTEAARKENTVRTVTALKLRRSGDRITMEIDGTGFLYNMVRAIAGTLAALDGRELVSRADLLEAMEFGLQLRKRLEYRSLA